MRKLDSRNASFPITKVIAGVLVVVIVGGMIYGLAKLGSSGTSSNSSSSGTVEAIKDNDHIQGPREAKHTLIEYGDFQCPACGSAHPYVNQLKEELGDNLTFVYRHFPLSSHENAEETAWAAEAAGLQGKFFEMYDMLYDNQSDWAPSSDITTILEDYAKKIGLNVDQYKKDYQSGTVRDAVKEDQQSGRRAAVRSTPTFYLDGKKMVIKNFQELLDQVREAAGGSSSTTNSTTNATTSNATK